MLCEWAGAIINGETGELLEYRHIRKNPKYRDAWGILLGNEIGRLAQGMKGRAKVANTVSFIKKEELPQNRFRAVTYDRVVCDVREGKSDEYRKILTFGGERIKYPGD